MNRERDGEVNDCSFQPSYEVPTTQRDAYEFYSPRLQRLVAACLRGKPYERIDVADLWQEIEDVVYEKPNGQPNGVPLKFSPLGQRDVLLYKNKPGIYSGFAR